MKSYYQDDYATIYHGDCRDILPELPKVDLVLTDPPWNLNYFNDDNKSWDEYTEWLDSIKKILEIKSKNVWIFQSTKAVPHVAHIFKGWYMFASIKNFCQMVPSKLPNAFDIAFYNSNEGYKGNGRNWHLGNNANIKNAGTGHPTSRPLDTIRFIISMFDYITILDPFMGSGTTLRAAKDLGRKSTGIEIEEKYCEIAAERLRQEVLNFG